jgi:ATP-binding cassette, subfamily B, bacterial
VSRRREWTSIFAWGWRAAPRQLLVTAAFWIGNGLASLIYPIGIALVIDAALKHDASKLVAGVALVAVLFTVYWAFGMFGGIAAAKFSNQTTFYLNARVAEQLHAISGIDHLERPAYRTELDILQENLQLLGNGARQMLVILSVLVRTVGIIVILAVIYPPLALLPLVAIAPILGERYSVSIRQQAEERMADRRRLANELFELATSAGAAKELRVFGAMQPLSSRHAELAAAVTEELNRVTLRGSLSGIAGWLVFAIGFVAGITTVVIRATHGHASIGEVVLAVTMIQTAQLQVGAVADGVGQLLTTARQARRLLWLEDYAATERRAIEDRPLTAPPTTLSRGIRLNRVSFSYPSSDSAVLSDIDLMLPAGSAVAVVGENGAGKTTLIKLLTGMYQPTAGSILLDDTPLSDIDPAVWRARTAATFQDFIQFELVAQEVVGIGDLEHITDEATVTTALERANAQAIIEELHNGLQTPLGSSFEHGQQLSGGQWQRLALARGMMRPTPLLLVLDEPTASLDAITEAALFERYLAARENARATGAITVLVSHRFSTVRMADVIVVLERGRITEQGSHEQLMRSGGLYAQLFEMQAQAYR